MIDTVTARFGLTRMPFGRDLPPSRLHRHADCAEAAARIAWAVSGRTIGVITGEVGTGKTAAARAAVAGLDPAGHNVIYVGNPATGVRGILAAAVTALGGKPAERGRTLVLIIDEAHLLGHEQLEAVRLMTNHEMDSSTPFATILVGQPTLRHNIKLGVLAANVILSFRVGQRCDLRCPVVDSVADGTFAT
jgi:type II secretory pathway predicted ATPase ExeA